MPNKILLITSGTCMTITFGALMLTALLVGDPHTKHTNSVLSSRTSSEREETSAREEESNSRESDTEDEERSTEESTTEDEDRTSESDERDLEEERESDDSEPEELPERRQVESPLPTRTETRIGAPTEPVGRETTPESTTETTTRERAEQTEEPMVETPVVVAPPTQSAELSFSKGESQEEEPVSGAGLDVSLEGRNIRVEKAGQTYQIPNNLGQIQDSYIAQGRTLEKVEITVEDNADNQQSGSGVYLNLDMTKPVKLLFVFNVDIREKVKVDAQSGKELEIERPWWSFLTRDKNPREVIKNYCDTDKDCGQHEDGNLCNGTLYCNASRKQCQLNPYSVIECPPDKSGDGCMKKSCNPSSGKCEMRNLADGTACDDGNSCTAPDSCQKGVCQPGGKSCQCQVNADCVAYEDGNLCNGTLFCDAVTKKCEVNPTTVINCYTQQTNGCLQNICNPASGLCEIKPVNEGKSCPTPSACYDSRCSAEGVCLINWNFTKNPGNGNKCECTNDQDCESLEDNNLCNGTLFCNKLTNICELNPATIISCPTADDTECKLNTCEPLTGACKLTPANIGQTCEATHPCNDAVCSASGECQQTWNYDKSVSSGGKCICLEDADCAPLEDGNLCNGVLYCDKANGTCHLNPATTVTCPSVNDTETMQNICQPATGQCVMTKVD